MNARVLAFAKLNVNLEVLERRADGYHEIRSIVQTIDLADRLTLTDASDVCVVCEAPIDGVNLAERAARAVLERKNAAQGVRIALEKRIPMGAGLGGGSSDAAAVLAVLNRHLSPRLDDRVLRDIAASIGADVPLFLEGGCLELSGLGTQTRRLPARTESYLVVVPPIHCATADVYRAWSPDRTTEPSGSLGRNDLAAPAANVHPELAVIADAVRRLGGRYCGMSGSGSAFYAAFETRAEVEAAKRQLVGRLNDARVYCCSATTAGYLQEGDDG